MMKEVAGNGSTWSKTTHNVSYEANENTHTHTHSSIEVHSYRVQMRMYILRNSVIFTLRIACENARFWSINVLGRYLHSSRSRSVCATQLELFGHSARTNKRAINQRYKVARCIVRNINYLLFFLGHADNIGGKITNIYALFIIKFPYRYI